MADETPKQDEQEPPKEKPTPQERAKVLHSYQKAVARKIRMGKDVPSPPPILQVEPPKPPPASDLTVSYLDVAEKPPVPPAPVSPLDDPRLGGHGLGSGGLELPDSPAPLARQPLDEPIPGEKSTGPPPTGGAGGTPYYQPPGRMLDLRRDQGPGTPSGQQQAPPLDFEGGADSSMFSTSPVDWTRLVRDIGGSPDSADATAPGAAGGGQSAGVEAAIREMKSTQEKQTELLNQIMTLLNEIKQELPNVGGLT